MGSAELDNLYKRLGMCGLFPCGFWILLNFHTFYSSFLFMGNAIMIYKPKFWCDSYNGSFHKLTEKEICDIGCPNGNWTFESPSPWLPASTFTPAAEWKLVCGRDILSNLVEASFFAGGLLGCLFCGYLSDKYGRRYVALFATVWAAVVGVQVLWVNSVWFYCILRFCLGLTFTGHMSLITLKGEMFSSSRRVIALNGDFGWPVASMVLGLIAWAIPVWRHALCLIYLSPIPILIAIILMVPESVPWLIKNNRKKEAFDIMKRVADARGQELSEKEFMEQIANDEEEEGINLEPLLMDDGKVDINENVVDELDTKVEVKPAKMKNGKKQRKGGEDDGSFCRALRSKTYVLTLAAASLFWAYSNFLYIGLTFSYGTLAGNRIVNFILMNFISLPGRILAFPVCMFIRRRPALAATISIPAVVFLISAVVRGTVDDYEHDYKDLRKALNLIAKAGVAIMFEVFWLWQQETFPTLLRGRSFLVAMLFGRVVSGCATFMPYFQTRSPLILESAIGIIGIAVAFTTLKIPETFGEPLPHKLEELKAMKKKTKSWEWY